MTSSHSKRDLPERAPSTSHAPIFLLLFLFLHLIQQASPLPHVRTEYNERRFQTESHNSDPANYLQRFGYLPGSDFETGALRTEEEFSRAIRELQRFANIPVTGRLDPATIAMMNNSRCGVRDLLESKGHPLALHSSSSSGAAIHGPQQYFLGPSKWQKRWLSFRLLNYTPDLARGSTRDAIIRAFHVWSKVIPITFHEVDSGYADIYIQFSPGYHQDGYPFDGKGGILAHAFFPGEERGGDVHFDEDETWTVYTDKGTNLFIVAAHELGHSLGLAHSNVPGSLMYPWHQGYKPDFQLHYDDILAIQTLYGSKEPPQGHTPAARPTTTTTKTTTTTLKPTVTAKSTSKTTTTTTTKKQTTTATTTTTTTTTTSRTPTTRAVTSHTHHPTRKHHKNHQDDHCYTYIDAISIIRGETFIFKADKFWRINKSGLVSKTPTLTTSFWKGIPKHVEKIDAVIERPSDHKIVFFSGKLYWELHGTSLAHGFPPSGRRISDFGLPEDLERIDAAFVWGHNKKVYFVSGDMYWRLNDSKHKVEYDYPRDMSMWEGVKLPVDAAFANKDGVTYFFHGPHFWEFNDARMKVRHEHHPGHIGQYWLNCTSGTDEGVYDRMSGDEGVQRKKVEGNSSSGKMVGVDVLLLFSMVAFVML